MKSNLRSRFSRSFALVAAILAVVLVPMAIPMNAQADETEAITASAPQQESNTMRFWAAAATRCAG